MTDYPGSIYVPADPSNYYRPENHDGVPNKPRALFLHTPEEPADNYESTPVFFQTAGRDASTHYYADSDGDWYQLVPENCAAIANGLRNKPLPAWADPNTSLNWQSLSVEIEGFAATVHLTCLRGGPQWQAIVRWVADRSRRWNIPLDRAHVMGHYEVADNRSDPGALDIRTIVADAQALAAALEDDTMPVPWVDCANLPAGKPYRSYMIIGGRKVHISSGEQETAYLKAGYIKKGLDGRPVHLTLADLKAIPGEPQPDAP